MINGKDEVDVLAALAEPFHPDKLKWRIGTTNKDKTRGLALVYVDAREVMDRLDSAVGGENWKDTYAFGMNGEIICTIHIRVTYSDGSVEWVGKGDGAGQTDIEAIKGGISDSFKRAAVKWGIGRYLYDFPDTWVELENRGGRPYIKQAPPIPSFAYPKGMTPPKANSQTTATKKEAKPANPSLLEKAGEYQIPEHLAVGTFTTIKTMWESGDPGKSVVRYIAGLEHKNGMQYNGDEKLIRAALYYIENA